MTRCALTGSIVLAAAGIAGAAVGDPPPSSPELVGRTTQSTDLALSGFDGTGTTVAVIDTGVADVAGMDGSVVHQENISAAPAAGDQYGHGTFVAGLVHATAPGAKIVSVKLSGANGAVDVTQVLAALRWVVRHKDTYSIDVVNLSFGTDSQQSPATSPLNYAVQQAWDAGIVVVASAGNLGDQPGTVTKPADDPLIISVGASNENGTSQRTDDTITSFDSRGPTRDGLAKPDLVAPGSRVVSLRAPGSTIDVEHPEARVGDTGFRGSGTSFAAPIVAGIAAQMLGANPALTPDRVKYGILSTARPIDGDPAAQGAGTIRAQLALAAASSGRANVGVTRGNGNGSIEGSRGSARVRVVTPVIDEVGQPAAEAVDVVGERTAEVPVTADSAPDLEAGDTVTESLSTYVPDVLVDSATWQPVTDTTATVTDLLAPVTTTVSTNASRWGASRWGASRWGAAEWSASRWGAAQWWASRWG